MVVLGREEELDDLPDFKAGGNQATRSENRYVEYSSARKVIVIPEENILGLPGDRFGGKSLVISAMARAFHQVTGLRPVDPEFDKRREKQQYELRVTRLDIEFDHRLGRIYNEATNKRLWNGTPASRSRVDYLAAGVEAYFDAAGDIPTSSLAAPPIATREALEAYDPDLFSLVEETMAYKGHTDWRFRP